MYYALFFLGTSKYFFWKSDNKFNKESLKTQEKTQNSRKKLRVWGALAPYVSPSGVKKNA